MSWFRYTYSQFLLSQRVFWRDLGFALTGALLPLGFSIAYVASQHGKGSVGGFDTAVWLLPGFMAFVLFWIVYNVINSAATRRDALIYKRLRGTPLPDSAILTGEAVSGSVTSLLQVVVLLVVGLAAFGAPVPRNVPLLVIGIITGAVTFAVLAMAVSGILPSAEFSTWIVTLILWAMMLGSGVLIPIAMLPHWLQTPVQFLPWTPVVEIVKTAYLGRDFVTAGGGSGVPPAVGLLGAFHVSAPALGVLCAWLGIGASLGKRYFRWDPRRVG
jgi:ABC-2 type transport system permease protein